MLFGDAQDGAYSDGASAPSSNLTLPDVDNQELTLADVVSTNPFFLIYSRKLRIYYLKRRVVLTLQSAVTQDVVTRVVECMFLCLIS